MLRNRNACNIFYTHDWNSVTVYMLYVLLMWVKNKMLVLLEISILCCDRTQCVRIDDELSNKRQIEQGFLKETF